MLLKHFLSLPQIFLNLFLLAGLRLPNLPTLILILRSGDILRPLLPLLPLPPRLILLPPRLPRRILLPPRLPPLLILLPPRLPPRLPLPPLLLRREIYLFSKLMTYLAAHAGFFCLEHF